MHSLGRLRGDFEAFLTRLSRANVDDRKKERFLYNNYSLVLTIISVSTFLCYGEFTNLSTAIFGFGRIQTESSLQSRKNILKQLNKHIGNDTA